MRAYTDQTDGSLPGGGEPSVLDDRHAADDAAQPSGWAQADIERALRRERERSLGSAHASAERALERIGVPRALARHAQVPTPLPGRWGGDPELVVAADPCGDAAELFRELRVQLAAQALNRKARAALAVVSPGRQDGKSYVAANLAAAFGQLGGQTLLVDADLRSPRLHHLFGVDGGAGLGDVLRGEATSTELVQPIPQVPGLSFLPAGGMPPNPVELLQAPRFQLLMLELLLAYDHVIVDTPALACGADAQLVASTAGVALVVGRQGSTRMDALHGLLGRLAQQQVEVAGVVMNRHRG